MKLFNWTVLSRLTVLDSESGGCRRSEQMDCIKSLGKLSYYMSFRNTVLEKSVQYREALMIWELRTNTDLTCSIQTPILAMLIRTADIS